MANRGLGKQGLGKRGLGTIAWVCLLAGCAADGPRADEGSPAASGTIAVYVATSGEGSGSNLYALRMGGSDTDQRRLVFASPPAFAPDTPVKVWGRVLDDEILVDRFEVQRQGEPDVSVGAVSGALIDGPALSTRKYAFVMVDIGGGTNITAAQAQTRMFGTGPTDGSIKQYMLETSYGRQDITGGVVGPLSFPMPNVCNVTGLTVLRPQVDAALGGPSQHYLWYFGSRNTACTWGGLGMVGTPTNPARDSFVNGGSSCVVLAQTPQLNLGQRNSSSLRCPGAPLVSNLANCTHSQYGDRYDVMGGGCNHMNAWQKGYRGWFGGCNRVRVRSSGTFTLLPIEPECNGIQVLQIRMPGAARTFVYSEGGVTITQPITHYYLELRTRTGFDQPMTNAPTVLVHVGPDYRAPTQSGTNTWLLDMNPATTTFDGMGAGASFTDPAGGVTFQVQSLSASSATINVTIAGGVGGPVCVDGGTLTPPGPASCGP